MHRHTRNRRHHYILRLQAGMVLALGVMILAFTVPTGRPEILMTAQSCGLVEFGHPLPPLTDVVPTPHPIDVPDDVAVLDLIEPMDLDLGDRLDPSASAPRRAE